MIELQEDNLQEIVNANEKVMVQYGAGWCGNCRIMKPKFKRLSGEHADIRFVYVDAEKMPQSRGLAEVKNLPTFAGFKNGQLVLKTEGNKSQILNDVLNAVTSN